MTGRASSTRQQTAPGALVVVGIGEDGWEGLGTPARAVLREARAILGSPRQLALLPDDLTAIREPWPSPMAPRVDALAAAIRAGADPSRWVVLASGDPMLHGVGVTLARALDGGRGGAARRMHVIPAPSAFSLACARLGWAQHATPLVSRVADPAQPVTATLLAAGRAVVYVAGPGGAADLAAVLRDEQLSSARLVVMERLGGPGERIVESTVGAWTADADALHLVALELADDPEESPISLPPAEPRVAGAPPSAGGEPRTADAQHSTGTPTDAGDAPAGRLHSPVPGLPDELYGGDGQLTRAEVRAVALAALAPRPGERLWDVGAGSGTIAIEWCRAVPQASAIAIERREDRAATIRQNGAALGAAHLEVVVGAAPLALQGLPTPQAIFIGGGPAVPGLIDACWQALPPGGRLVANAVTLEGEHAIVAAHAALGGRLIRLELSSAEPLGTFTGWKPQRPVVQWSTEKPTAPSAPPAASPPGAAS